MAHGDAAPRLLRARGARALQPHIHRHKKLRIKLTENHVEIFLNLERLAIHPRSRHRDGPHMKIEAHFPPASQAYYEATLTPADPALQVHEMLYMSADSTQEVLLPTLLRALGDALRQSFPEMADRVRLQVTSDPVILSPDEAIPIALLANEVVTNAYKHAFPEGSSGEITLSLTWLDEQALVLKISDNGIGMHSNGGPSALGLKLVRTLAAQLGGRLAVAEPVEPVGATGTTVTLHWSAKRRREL